MVTRRKGRSRRGTLRRRNTFRRERCSPSAKEKYTCYSKNTIHQLKQYWNDRHPDKKIKAKHPKGIWSELQRKLQHVCTKESCWLEQEFIKNNKFLVKSFAPKSPASWAINPTTWLDSLDLLNVMDQYKEAYANFDFIGPTPIDWNYKKVKGKCVWEDLCRFDLSEQIKTGKTNVGIIFNLDIHSNDGTHWVALYISITSKRIIYFNSLGYKAPSYINKFIAKVQKQAQQLDGLFTVTENTIIHQETDTECGIYCLYFIIEMLKLKKPKLFTTRIPDKKMERLRKIYFRPFY